MAGLGDPIGVKQRDLQPCRLCGRGVMHAGSVTFHRVTIERFVVNLPAVRRQAGLEAMMCSAGDPFGVAVAQVLGPNEDMARTLPELRQQAWICGPCAVAFDSNLFDLAERIERGAKATGRD